MVTTPENAYAAEARRLGLVHPARAFDEADLLDRMHAAGFTPEAAARAMLRAAAWPTMSPLERAILEAMAVAGATTRAPADAAPILAALPDALRPPEPGAELELSVAIVGMVARGWIESPTLTEFHHLLASLSPEDRREFYATLPEHGVCASCTFVYGRGHVEAPCLHQLESVPR